MNPTIISRTVTGPGLKARPAMASYVTRAFDYARSRPFYKLNRRYYAPPCDATMHRHA